MPGVGLLWWYAVDFLYAVHTFSRHGVKVCVLTAWAGLVCVPHKVVVTAVTGAVTAVGRQLYGAVTLL